MGRLLCAGAAFGPGYRPLGELFQSGTLWPANRPPLGHKKERLYGDLFYLYGVIYAVIRFFIEYLRPDAWKIGGMPTAQIVSIGIFVLFGSLLIVRHKLRRPKMLYAPGTPWIEPEEDADQEESEEVEQ